MLRSCLSLRSPHQPRKAWAASAITSPGSTLSAGWCLQGPWPWRRTTKTHLQAKPGSFLIRMLPAQMSAGLRGHCILRPQSPRATFSRCPCERILSFGTTVSKSGGRLTCVPGAMLCGRGDAAQPHPASAKGPGRRLGGHILLVLWDPLR